MLNNDDIELGPGQCACGRFRKACGECFERQDCEECGSAGHCVCSAEPTVEIPAVTMAQLVFGGES